MMPQWTPKWVEVPITVTLDAYDATDVVGGTLTSDAIKQAKGGGYINCIRLIDDACQAEPYTLYVYKSAPSAIADAGAYTQTVADALLCIGKIAIAAADYDTTGSACDMAFVYGLGGTQTSSFIFFEALAGQSLYFRLVPSATPDYAAADDLTLHICLMVM
jgi:hypothetical protein